MEKCLTLNGHTMAPSPDPRKRTLNFLPCPEFLSHHAFPGKWIESCSGDRPDVWWVFTLFTPSTGQRDWKL